MQAVDESIERSMHAIDFYIAEADVCEHPEDMAAACRLRAAAHGLRFSSAYRSGDPDTTIDTRANTRNFVILATVGCLHTWASGVQHSPMEGDR